MSVLSRTISSLYSPQAATLYEGVGWMHVKELRLPPLRAAVSDDSFAVRRIPAPEVP